MCALWRMRFQTLAVQTCHAEAPIAHALKLLQRLQNAPLSPRERNDAQARPASRQADIAISALLFPISSLAAFERLLTESGRTAAP